MKLLNYSFSGIRNIKHKQTVNFTKKREIMSYLNGDQLFNLNDENIKGLFGLNGSGKSSSLYCLYILKDLVQNKLIIENPETINHSFIKNLINKQTKEIKLEIEFLVNEYIYFIVVSLGLENDVLFLSDQSIYRKKNLSRHKSHKLYESKNKSSKFGLYNWDLIEEEDFKNIYNFFDNLIIIPASNDKIKFIETKTIELPEEIRNNNSDDLIFTITEKMLVHDIDKYLHEIKIFELLIKKMLKKDLIKIDVDYELIDEQKNLYAINDIILDYGYKISLIFESSGIKRIYKVFSNIFITLNKGGIVVVDEIDIFFHNDLIKAIIEYSIFYSKGQLIFTTHNLMILDVLENANNSIIIVNNHQNLVSIPKGSGTSSLSKYLNGKISNTNIPINLHDLYEGLKWLKFFSKENMTLYT